MKAYLTHEHPIRFAHRGSRILWPENTVVAFQGAVDIGYRYLETDVHVSRDGKVVMFHDDGLERLTDGRGRVWDHDWAYLRTLDAGYHFDPDGGHPRRGQGIGIPLLEEVLGIFPEACLNIDLKQERIARAVAGEIGRLGAENRVLIGSFHNRRIRHFRRATDGRVATSAGPSEVTRAMAAAMARRQVGGEADAFQVPPVVATKRFVAAAHAVGKQVHVWTVNDSAEMRRLLGRGVDGIVTDRPDVLNEVVFGSPPPQGEVAPPGGR
jgi:glycerophosphoryl diester phosphodiesterase